MRNFWRNGFFFWSGYAASGAVDAWPRWGTVAALYAFSLALYVVGVHLDRTLRDPATEPKS